MVRSSCTSFHSQLTGSKRSNSLSQRCQYITPFKRIGRAFGVGGTLTSHNHSHPRRSSDLPASALILISNFYLWAGNATSNGQCRPVVAGSSSRFCGQRSQLHSPSLPERHPMKPVTATLCERGDFTIWNCFACQGIISRASWSVASRHLEPSWVG